MADIEYLQLLASKFPTHRAVKAEIINLRAINSLPKGTEFWLSDIHGEYDAFEYFVRSGSGIIKQIIDVLFSDELSESERGSLASLIYNPERELTRRQRLEPDYDAWCRDVILRMVKICRLASSNYTRSKVRNHLPEDSGYIMEELLFAETSGGRLSYYDQIIKALIENHAANTFIKEFADVISFLVVDKLHIVGDIYDRGPKSHEIMDFLISRENVDFVWGNHDLLWMGAALGNLSCIANMMRINVRYNNFDMLEYGYGLNLRQLSSLAEKLYKDDPCDIYMPNTLDQNRFDPIPERLAAKMHKLIAVCQFKCEGQEIIKHPEYQLSHRQLLDKINWEDGTVTVAGKTYPMRDMNFPTIDPSDPFRLTSEEQEVMYSIQSSIFASDKLNRHMDFLYSHGSMYQIYNNMLYFHGSIPMTADGDFKSVIFDGERLSGRKYLDAIDAKVREIRYAKMSDSERADAASLLWYLWLSEDSPLFGKDQMTTFERLFIEDKSTHRENTVPYYKLIDSPEICDKILEEFSLDTETGTIINGHVPVKSKDGEQPIKASGKLLMIDGGISKAYQATTGIAGYTAISSADSLMLAEHEPYEPIDQDGEQNFHHPKILQIKEHNRKLLIQDTCDGARIKQEIEVLEELLQAYNQGIIKEKGVL